MADILENGQFLFYAVKCTKTHNRILMLEVSYIKNNCQNICLKICIRDFVARLGLLRLECEQEKLGAILENGRRLTAVPKHHI